MLSIIRHRGPDGEGIYQHENLILGHRLLSIIDLSTNAAQPMFYDNDYVITYNGEIYNYIEIREQLVKLGYQFKSKSDTEVLLAAYHYWGEDCVHQFNGMWAFAIHDKKQRKLFCSRDRFGIKPFYYYQNNSVFCFGSEIKQILTLKPQAKVHQQVMFNYLFAGFEEYNAETFFDDILKLPAGTSMVYNLDDHSMVIKPFYKLKPALLGQTDDEHLIGKSKQLFEDSIRLRLRSDVRVGACLSGGLDSSSISVVAAALYRNNAHQFGFSGFHGKSVEKASDESAYASLVAEQAGFELFLIEKQRSDYQHVLTNVVKTQEEPFGSPSVIMQYFVLQKAREQGVTVLLDGQGGDELLLGYERYFVSWLFAQKTFQKIRNFRKAVNNSKLNPVTLFSYYLYFTSFFMRFSKIKNRFYFIKPHFFNHFDKTLLKEHIQDFKQFSTLQTQEIVKYQLPHLLKYEDKNSMAHSIETRLPFLDYRLAELFLSLPMDIKIREGWSKYILRKAMESQLPHSIAWRKDKFGFLAPVNNWLSDKHEIEAKIKQSAILKPMLNNKPLPTNDLSVLWKLYNIALWEQAFNVTPAELN